MKPESIAVLRVAVEELSYQAKYRADHTEPASCHTVAMLAQNLSGYLEQIADIEEDN
tara:strand:- start:62 stop:232 length:171 start_codon:yes stop_codon:yes gene_type:complete